MSIDRTIIGVMTGTSMDAIDASLIHITGSGLNMQVREESFHSIPLTGLQDELRKMAAGSALPGAAFARVGRALGELVAAFLSERFGSSKPDLVVLHGQTIHHTPPLTWQLIDPWPVALRLRRPVLYDLRRADLAAGGQGAPLTPISDLILFSDLHHARAIVNLGGFCNVTILPSRGACPKSADSIRGFDVCPCNHWLDRATQHFFGIPFDASGALAQNGSVITEFRDRLLSVWTTKHDRTSLGSEHEELAFPGDCSGENVLATLCDVIGRLVSEACTGCDQILCAGGSTLNEHLMACIGQYATCPVSTTQSAGINPLHREAIAMGVLGALCQDGIPIGLPQVTGSSQRVVSGSWCFPDGISGTLGHA